MEISGNSTSESPATKNRGGRPPKALSADEIAKLVARPEMQAVIQQSVAAVLSNSGIAPAAAEVQAGDPNWANKLAVAITMAADPKRKQVDPALIEQRRAARERMTALIARAKADGHVPEYQLTRGCYLEEQWIESTYIGSDRVVRKQVIGWSKVPSVSFIPMNDTAREIFASFLESVGGLSHEGQRPTEAVTGSGGNLRVFQDGKLQNIPEARSSRGGQSNLSLRGHAIPGQVVETAVLGTVHPAARQIA